MGQPSSEPGAAASAMPMAVRVCRPPIATRPLLILLLDGVPYRRIRRLYDAGLFRRFKPPARVISVFPTLTDPAYDLFFGTGPTPGWEAAYFDRHANRSTPGLRTYLRGHNEKWVRFCDFRLNFVEDGVMYLFPRAVFASELRRVRRMIDTQLAAGRRHIVGYILSTDALGHMLDDAEIDRQLARLDAWIARLMDDYHGDLEIAALADHGISALAPEHGYVRPFRLATTLREAGLRLKTSLNRPGDLVLSRFGLLDVARLHTFDDDTRDRAVEAVRSRPEIELVASRVGDVIRVCRDGQTAEIRRLGDIGPARYSYETIEGDPLGLADRCRGFPDIRAGAGGWVATADEWLQATWNHDFPSAPPRLWDGIFVQCRERPDVVVSLTDRWFIGSGLFAGLVRMHGTHGGLHRRVSETFAMTTSAELPSPTTLVGVREALGRLFGWQPGDAPDNSWTTPAARGPLGDAGFAVSGR